MLKDIRYPVESAMEAYQARVQALFAEATDELRPLLDHLLAHRGKAIRPLLVMLCAGLFEDSARRGERALVGATMIELVHTASLVHDDVIDRSPLRRAAPTLNALWGDHAAILVGDYILARGFAEGLESGHWDIVTQVNRSLAAVCEGEMMQSRSSERLDMTREHYYRIIRRKTALLLSTAARLGAMAADAPPEQVEALAHYGDMVGMAFQIGDDVLDYRPAAETGKPLGADMRERKINLPLLLLLESSGAARREELLAMLAAAPDRPAHIETLCRAVVESDAIARAAEVLKEFTSQATRALDAFPDSDCKRSLIGLCSYLSCRER